MRDEFAWVYAVLREEDIEELESRDNHRQFHNALTAYGTAIEVLRKSMEDQNAA